MRYRTTLQLDEDVYRAARSLAEAKGRSLGSIVSELARRGLDPRQNRVARPRSGGFPTFEVSGNAPPLTTDMVRAALDDEGA